MPGHTRARYLYALARQIQKHSRRLAVLETIDNGKPIRETRDIDIPLVARHFYHHAGWAQLMETELAGYAPLGVVGQIIPWNFPLLMLAWKIAPALAMGNTVVLKPAEWTSLTALAFAEICQEIGLPPGVVNIVTGDGAVGELIVKHPGIDKIAFTGSTEVGRIIRKATAGSGKKLSLELGGKSPFVVFDDADLDSVVEGVVDAIWFNQGQVCCAGSRLLVQEGIAPRLIEKLRARMEKLRVGDPLDKAIDIGAIVAPAQLQKIQRLVEQGRAEGATMWQPSWACPTEGYFFPPTLFTDVAPAATIAQVEIFGPVLVAIDLPHAGRGGGAGQQHALRPGRQRLEREHQPGARHRAQDQGRRGLDQLHQPVRCGGRLRRLPRERLRARGRQGRAVRVRQADRSTSDRSTRTTTIYGGDRRPTPGWSRQPQDGNGRRQRPRRTHSSILSTCPPLDRTPKHYIGGKQARPDSGYSRPVYDARGHLIGEVGDGNRKDIRNAVEAARAAASWAGQTAHNRAQILYYIAENLSARADEFAQPAARDRPATAPSWPRAGGRGGDRAAVHLRRLGRQVRWRGPRHAVPQRHAGGARADRRDRHRLPG